MRRPLPPKRPTRSCGLNIGSAAVALKLTGSALSSIESFGAVSVSRIPWTGVSSWSLIYSAMLVLSWEDDSQYGAGRSRGVSRGGS